jgi:hypothetical protein
MKSTNKSNADIADSAALRFVQEQGVSFATDSAKYRALVSTIESALTTAQSQLAEKVLAEMRGDSFGKFAEKRLRDLFTKLGIPTEGA